MNLGETVSLKIDSIAYRGQGVSRHEGCVVFTDGVCQGEIVDARVTRMKRNYAEASVVRVTRPSPDRIDPVCRIDGRRVPGCVYDHMSYPAEVKAKVAQFRDFLFRQGRRDNVDEIMFEPFASPRDLHYRNKIVLHAQRRGGKLALGYLGEDNVTVMDIPQCPLAVPEINEKLAQLRADESWMERLRDGDSVTFRWTPAKGVLPWVGDTRNNLPPLKENTTFGDLEVPAGAFYQVNPFVSCELVRLAQQVVSEVKPKAVIDIYCGVGVFALSAAALGVKRCMGVETGRTAIAAARRNAERLGFKDAQFECMSAAPGLNSALEASTPGGMAHGACVFLDPPREGLDENVIKAIARRRPGTIVYVSCAPDTLVRDLNCLRDMADYEISSTRLLDMFPRTAHFETFTVLRCC